MQGIGDVGTYRQVRPTCQPAGGCYYKERMPLNLHAPAFCIPSFNKRLCAVPVYVHFEKQRTHLVGTSLYAPCWPATPIRDKEEKAEIAMRAGQQCRGRRCRDVPAGASDMSTGRRMLLQRTDATEPPRADPLHPVFYQDLYAVPAYVHFEKQRTHLVGTSLHLLADRQPKSGIRRKRKNRDACRTAM